MTPPLVASAEGVIAVFTLGLALGALLGFAFALVWRVADKPAQRGIDWDDGRRR